MDEGEPKSVNDDDDDWEMQDIPYQWSDLRSFLYCWLQNFFVFDVLCVLRLKTQALNIFGQKIY